MNNQNNNKYKEKDTQNPNGIPKYENVNVNKTLNSMYEEDSEIFTYPKIEVPNFSSEVHVSNLGLYISEISKIIGVMEQTMRNIYKELIKRPTRFESMGHMLLRYIMRNDHYQRDFDDKAEEINDPNLKTLDTKNLDNLDGLEKQKVLIENMRTNLIKSTDYKIGDIKKNVTGVNDFLKSFDKAVSLKLQMFDGKLKEMHTECADSLNILKDYLVKEHANRKNKRIFKAWVLYHNYIMKVKSSVKRIFNKVHPDLSKRAYLDRWHKKMLEQRYLQEQEELKYKEQKFLEAESNIKSLQLKTQDLDSNKLDKVDFEDTKKYMDINYIKHYCDEVKDIIDVYQSDIQVKIDSNDRDVKNLVVKLHKQLNSKLNEDSFNLMKARVEELVGTNDELKNDYSVIVDKISHLQTDYNIHLKDKFMYLNSKLDLFQKEINKIWDFEEEHLITDKHKESRKERNKSVSNSNLNPSNNHLTNKKYIRNYNNLLNLDRNNKDNECVEMELDKSIVKIDLMKQSVEISSNKNSHGNEFRPTVNRYSDQKKSTILIDLNMVDTDGNIYNKNIKSKGKVPSGYLQNNVYYDKSKDRLKENAFYENENENHDDSLSQNHQKQKQINQNQALSKNDSEILNINNPKGKKEEPFWARNVSNFNLNSNSNSNSNQDPQSSKNGSKLNKSADFRSPIQNSKNIIRNERNERYERYERNKNVMSSLEIRKLPMNMNMNMNMNSNTNRNRNPKDKDDNELNVQLQLKQQANRPQSTQSHRQSSQVQSSRHPLSWQNVNLSYRTNSLKFKRGVNQVESSFKHDYDTVMENQYNEKVSLALLENETMNERKGIDQGTGQTDKPEFKNLNNIELKLDY